MDDGRPRALVRVNGGTDTIERHTALQQLKVSMPLTVSSDVKKLVILERLDHAWFFSSQTTKHGTEHLLGAAPALERLDLHLPCDMMCGPGAVTSTFHLMHALRNHSQPTPSGHRRTTLSMIAVHPPAGGCRWSPTVVPRRRPPTIHGRAAAERDGGSLGPAVGRERSTVHSGVSTPSFPLRHSVPRHHIGSTLVTLRVQALALRRRHVAALSPAANPAGGR